MTEPTGVEFVAARFLAVVRDLDHAEAAIARVWAVLDHAAKVSPSAAMTVYVGDVAAALDGTTGRVRGIVGGNDSAATP